MADETLFVTLPGGVRADVSYKGFEFRTDQPVYAGGTNSAPSPFDYFLASLAGCAGYFVVAFFQERKIATEGLSLAMRTEREPKTKLISKVSIEIILPPGFPEKYRNAVIKAADQCTVKRHMMTPPAFEITAKSAS